MSTNLRWSDVTPKDVWLSRRKLLGAGLGAMAVPVMGLPAQAKIEAAKSAWSTDAKPNTFEEITNYNNFYEFGLEKTDPARNAGALVTDPWAVDIDGLVSRPGRYDLADILKDAPIEERIYRLRCVEGWSMVVPWIGFSLSHLLEKVGVEPAAKYVSFETAMRPDQMSGLRYPILDWPYREALRLDEAQHPLTILASGLYGEELPKQNGAPLRLVVPWKYGFKSIKSIVRITLTEDRPLTSWQQQNASEYGFFANVNPAVDHPRWSQASERRIGAGVFSGRFDTQIFNGYGDAVASLYAGQDLAKDY